MKVVNIVLNYNDYNLTDNYIKLHQNYRSIDKIVVVDNDSQDHSYTLLKQKYRNNDRVDVIQTTQNRGYANGNNFGMCYAIKKYAPEYFFITNPDIYYKEEVIGGILEFYEKNKDIHIGLVAPVQNNNRRADTASAWKLHSIKDMYLDCFPMIRKLLRKDLVYKKEEYIQEYKEVEVIAGSFFAVKADVMQKIGFFDSRTFLYCEEEILGFKLKKENYKNYILSQYNYIHEHSVTINKQISSELKRFNISHRSSRVYMKYYLEANRLQQFLLELCFGVFIVELCLRELIKRIIRASPNK